MTERSFTSLFFENLKKGVQSVILWGVRYPVAGLLAVFVIVGGVVAIRMGVPINIGSILKTLFGAPQGVEGVVAASNTLPKKRVFEDGVPVPVGVADVNGWTQWETVEWATSKNPLRDRGVIQITSQGETHEVLLPVGIKDTDVDMVIEVKPKVYVVQTNSESKHSARELLERLPRP